VERDPDTIEREIKKARDALAEDLDALSERPKRFAAQRRTSVQQRLADPKVKYGLIAVGVLIALAVLRKLFADADAPPASIEQCLESRLDGLDVRLARIEEQLHRVSRRPSDDPFEARIAGRTSGQAGRPRH
jgi:hypothetical protein